MADKHLTTFYIVRHGETEWNAQHRAQGHTDIPLNDNGRIQAKDLAKTFKDKDIHFDLAFSSDLIRAKETTEIIALEHNLAVETTQLLRERNLGEYEGKHTDAYKTFDELYRTLSEESRRTVRSDPASENDAELITRIITFIREIAITHPNKNILIGTHSGVIRILLTHLGFASYKDDYNVLKVENGAYFTLESDGIDFFIKETHGITKRENI